MDDKATLPTWMARTIMKHRPLGLEQWVSLLMLISAATFAIRPKSAVFIWIETNYGITWSPWVILVPLLVCGWLLGWMRHSGTMTFAILTLPTIMFALFSAWYSVAGGVGSLVPSVDIFALWGALQVIRALTEVLRQWTPTSATS